MGPMDAGTGFMGDGDGLVLVSRKDGTALRQLKAHKDTISGIAVLASTGIILTTSYDWTLKVWSLRGQCLVSRKAHHGQVLDFAVSDEEDFFVTAADDFTAKVVPFVWDDAAPLEHGEVGKVHKAVRRPGMVAEDDDDDDDGYD